MKRIILGSIVGIACMAFININKTIVDYRDSYIGSYSCRQIRSQRNTEQGKSPVSTTNTLIINVSKDAADSVLLFKVYNQTLKFKLLNKRLLGINGVNGGGCFFATDSLNLSYSEGRANSYKFLGKKK